MFSFCKPTQSSISVSLYKAINLSACSDLKCWSQLPICSFAHCHHPPCCWLALLAFQISGFLKAVREQLVNEFRELRHVSVDNLIYVKEDIILPHHYTFYDLIASKVRKGLAFKCTIDPWFTHGILLM